MRVMHHLVIGILLTAICGADLAAETAIAFLASAEERAENQRGQEPCRFDAVPRYAVMLTPERLARLRMEIADPANPRAAIYRASIRTQALRYLDRPVVVPELGGWYHDYFCRTSDGSRLEIPADQVFQDDQPARCPVCGATYLDDRIRGARRFLQHVWLGDAVRDLGLVYALEGDRRAAAKAAEIMTRYADVFIPRFGTPKGGIMRDSVVTGMTMIPFAQGYGLIHDTLSPDQRAHIEQDFLWPAAFRLSRCGMAHGGNWGAWHLSAMGVIGYATGHQRLVDLAQQQVLVQIADELGDDGVWPESVHTYHFFTLDGYLSLATAAANHGDDLLTREPKPGKSIFAMLAGPIRYAYPDFTLPAINDGWFGSKLPEDQYVVGNLLHPDPRLAWLIANLRSPQQADPYKDMRYRLALYDDPRPQPQEKPRLDSIDYGNIGISVLHAGAGSQATAATLDYGRSLNHGQADRMGVTLFAQGHLLAADYGTSGYGVPISQFLQGTLAHNTVMIDGKGQPRTKRQTPCVLSATPDLSLAAAACDEIEGVRWLRCLVLGTSYAVVVDRLDGDAPHRFDWLFHAEGTALEFDGAAAGEDGGASIAGPFITAVATRQAAGDRVTARWIPGPQGGLSADLLSAPGQVLQFGSMATPLARGVPIMSHRQQGNSARYAAVFRLRPELRAPAALQRLDGDRIVVSVALPEGGTDVIEFGPTRVLLRPAGGVERAVDLPPAIPSPDH